MPFEFVGRALRDAAGIFSGLTDEVGNGRANREDDVRGLQRAFGTLGRVEEPEDEPSGFIDRALDTAIHGCQRDKGLRVDGFMRPGGPTERSLQHDLRGLLTEERSGFGSIRGGGLDSLGHGQERLRSGGCSEPTLALRDDRREAGLDQGPTLALGGFDDRRSGRERALRSRGGGRLSLLDLGSDHGDAPILEISPGAGLWRHAHRAGRDEELVG